MATIKLAPGPVFQINKFGEVVGNDHRGPRHIIEAKTRRAEWNIDRVPTIQQLIDMIAEEEGVENVYLYTVETGLSTVKVRYGTHPDF